MKVELPLPSTIETHAQEAGARNARVAGRETWERQDQEAADAERERLIGLCYASRRQFVRAIELEANGTITPEMEIAQFWKALEDG